jgi:hypothetical protein
MSKTTIRVKRLFWMLICSAICCASIMAQEHGNSFRIDWDDFHNGFAVDGPGAKWFYFSFSQPGGGTYVGDDGTVTTSAHGLDVVSSGVNPATGLPAFTQTMAQEDDNAFGLPGQLDHIKWLAYMNHTATSGVPGFDAVAGEELSFEAIISGGTFGTAAHPFGSAMTLDPNDPRLAAVAMSVVDFETLIEFDFLLTNTRIYAVYARSPLGRDFPNNASDYAAFTFMIPVAERVPSDWHRLEIAYDKSAAVVRWVIDNREVFRVNNIGRRIDQRFLTLDHGGVEAVVSLNQLDAGMGMLTLLDGFLPSRIGLARLSNLPYFYFDPEVGEPNLQTFVDTTSSQNSRLFGQGAELGARRYTISSRHSHDE